MLRKSLLLCAFLCMFFAISVHFVYATTTASFTTNYDAGGTMVVGQNVSFESTSTGEGTMLCEWDYDNDGNVDATGDTATFSFSTPGWHTVRLTVTSSDETSDTITRSFEVKSWLLLLRAVGYKSKEADKWHVIYQDLDSQDAYTENPYGDVVGKDFNPQWWDKTLVGPDEIPNGNATDKALTPPSTTQPADDQKFPMCFTSGSTMKAIVIMQGVGNVPEDDIKLKGVDSVHGFNFEETSGGVDIAYDATEEHYVGSLECDKSFDSNKVDYYSGMAIDWQISVNGGAWDSIGESSNETYVTWKDPTSGTYKLGKLFHTLCHVACSNADEQTTKVNIISSIWNDFSDRTVLRKQDNEPLKYYDNHNTSNTTTAGLLGDDNANGQCHAWAMFFVDCLKVHDIHNSSNIIELTPNDGSMGFLVNDWDYTANPMNPPFITNYPYTNIKMVDDNYDEHEWLFTEVSDHDGVPGQSSSNPASFFSKHFICMIGTTYYDPSYGGSTISSLDTYETQKISGYWKYEEQWVSESGIDTCLNPEVEDPDDKLDTLKVDVWGIKHNPANNQLDSTPRTK